MARIWREICDTETRRTDRSETTHCRSRLALGLALACAFLSTRSYSPSRPLALAMSLARSHTQPLDIHTNGRLRGSVSKRTETERERERERSRDACAREHRVESGGGDRAAVGVARTAAAGTLTAVPAQEPDGRWLAPLFAFGSVGCCMAGAHRQQTRAHCAKCAAVRAAVS